MPLAFDVVALDAEPAAALVTAMREEIRALYDDLDIDSAGMPAAGPRELGPPDGTFLVGFDDRGEPVCCGGVKRLPDGACEIKRMYVAPEHRGRGIARGLLAALEDAARDLGYAVARLDTGPRQPQAERMFREAGYRPSATSTATPWPASSARRLSAVRVEPCSSRSSLRPSCRRRPSPTSGRSTGGDRAQRAGAHRPAAPRRGAVLSFKTVHSHVKSVYRKLARDQRLT